MIANSEISEEKEYKYLGLKMDAHLDMSSHIKQTVARLAFRLFMFRKIRYLLTTRTALLVYKVTILPQLEYASIVYNAGQETLLGKIQTLQNKCLKTALQLPNRTPTTEIHTLAKIETLNFRYKLALIKLACTRISDPKFLQPPSKRTRSGQAPLLSCPLRKKAASRRSTSYRTAHLWNSLPPRIRGLESLEAVTKATVEHWSNPP